MSHIAIIECSETTNRNFETGILKRGIFNYIINASFYDTNEILFVILAYTQSIHKTELDNLVTDLEEMEKLKRENEDYDNALKAKEAEKSNMLAVLQEKTRGSSQLKAENARLLQTISDLQDKLTKDDQEEMSKEAIHKLSKVIKDKDLEIDGLKSRNESLVTLVQTNSSNEVIDKLTKEKNDLQEKLSNLNKTITEKSVMDNSNEIIILKSKINELEKKLCFAEVKVEMQDASLAFNKSASRRRYHSGLDCVYAKRHAILEKLRDLLKNVPKLLL